MADKIRYRDVFGHIMKGIERGHEICTYVDNITRSYESSKLKGYEFTVEGIVPIRFRINCDWIRPFGQSTRITFIKLEFAEMPSWCLDSRLAVIDAHFGDKMIANIFTALIFKQISLAKKEYIKKIRKEGQNAAK